MAAQTAGNGIPLNRVRETKHSNTNLHERSFKSISVFSLTRCSLNLFPKFEEHEFVSPGHAINASRIQVQRESADDDEEKDFCTCYVANMGSVFRRNVNFHKQAKTRKTSETGFPDLAEKELDERRSEEHSYLGKTQAFIPEDDDSDDDDTNDKKRKRDSSTNAKNTTKIKNETEMIKQFEGQEYEIMTLKIRETQNESEEDAKGVMRMACADATGRVTVCNVPKRTIKDRNDDDEKAELLYRATPAYYVRDSLGPSGWAGLSFCPIEENSIAVCKLWTRTIDWFDKDTVVRTTRLLNLPTSIAHMETPHSGKSVLCIGENNEVVVYDVRVDKKNGEVGRVKQVASDSGRDQIQALEAASFSGNSVLCCAGKSRAVSVVDPRKWTTRYRWKNCAKYEVTGLYAPRNAEGFVCVASLDYEILCGNYEKGKLGGGFTFRNEARVVGIAGAKFGNNADVVCSWTDTGKLTAAKFSMLEQND